MQRTESPYGSWRSPITSDLIVASSVRLGHLTLDGDDVYWIEGRPTEGGRNVIVRRASGANADITPPGFNARTMVHEYGGGDFAVAAGTVYFANFGDQRLYRQESGKAPEPMTPEGPLRYADLIVDRHRRRLIAVREDHRDSSHQALNTIVAIDLGGAASIDEERVLLHGYDFYASPRLSADGRRLAWQSWNHPNMPWDGNELWVADLHADGTISQRELVAGGAEESIFQPIWSPDGKLYFVSDRSGWWNIYRWEAGAARAIAPIAAEFGTAQWVFGMATFGFQSPDRIIAAFSESGTWRLASIEIATGKATQLGLTDTDIRMVRVTDRRAVLIAGGSAEPVSVVAVDLIAGDGAGKAGLRSVPPCEVLRRSTNATVDPAYLSIPEPLTFPTEGGLETHALFYPPRNPDYRAPAGERPPLMVLSHGGPTGAASGALNLAVQYWTTRGFAVVDVNYGGSTGYGRRYRERLNGQWGIVDIDDCVNAALYLVNRGLADANRLIIAGGSAGGYTTLCALTFRETFKAGASYFGLGDLSVFVGDTHKFESRYLDRLIGPYPEARERYFARSPINFANRLSCPVILFQGLDDKVVPPNQAELFAAALRAKGLPFAYLAFPGEGHGFRRAETIKRTLDAELYFYSRIFGFPLPEPVEPVVIEDL